MRRSPIQILSRSGHKTKYINMEGTSLIGYLLVRLWYEGVGLARPHTWGGRIKTGGTNVWSVCLYPGKNPG